MPRKVTDAIVSAFIAGKTAKQANIRTDGNSLYLYDNEIAKMKNGQLWITNAGYPTRTTYERLNALPGVSISVKQGTPYLNGVEWDGNWISVGKPSALEAKTPNTNKIRSEVRNIIKKIIKEEVGRALGRKKVNENRLSKTTVSEATKGVNLQQPHSNLYIKGWGKDKNGNSIIIVGFPNDRGFSIQTNGTLPETHHIIRIAHKELSEDELDEIGTEITDYVKEYGSKDQKARLKVYNSWKGGKREGYNTQKAGAIRRSGLREDEGSAYKPSPVRGRYLQIKPSSNGNLILMITKEGKAELKDIYSTNNLTNLGQLESYLYDIFDDIQGNSEYNYSFDLGEDGFGLTSAPGIIMGNMDDSGQGYEEGSIAWYDPNYQIKSFVEDLIKKGSFEFKKASE